MNALDVLCAQLMRDLFAIAKFLFTIGRLLLHCWYSLGRHVTTGTPMVLSVFDDWHSVPFVKTVKNSQKTVKQQINDHWCTNRHMSTQSPPNTQIRANAATLQNLYTLFYLLMMPAARLVCQRPSSNFPYFWTPLANFMLSRPNSVEYGNSKTTTLLPSAKCTRPLFQGRTGCDRRPSGWHDCRVLSLSDCKYSLSPLSQTEID